MEQNFDLESVDMLSAYHITAAQLVATSMTMQVASRAITFGRETNVFISAFKFNTASTRKYLVAEPPA